MKKSIKELKPSTRRWIQGIIADYELEPSDARLAIMVGQQWDVIEECRKVLEVEGLFVNDRFGQRRNHPAVDAQRNATICFTRALRELNLDSEGPPDTRPPLLTGRYK